MLGAKVAPPPSVTRASSCSSRVHIATVARAGAGVLLARISQHSHARTSSATRTSLHWSRGGIATSRGSRSEEQRARSDTARRAADTAAGGRGHGRNLRFRSHPVTRYEKNYATATTLRRTRRLVYTADTRDHTRTHILVYTNLRPPM